MRFFLSAIILIGFFLHHVHADFGSYLKQLEGIGMSSEIIHDNQILYRNDVVRLLSTIQCIDCIHPNSGMVHDFNQERRNGFSKLPGNNFDDVIFNNYIWGKQNYYYCVAQAAKQGIINGYPRDISPFCPGKFCGVNLVKQGEIIQIIFNLKKQNINKVYKTNRTAIQEWLAKQPESSVMAKNFSVIDRENLRKSIVRCNENSCAVSTAEEFDLYAKYCTWNISSCSMVDFTYIKEGQRPIAELNILIQEGILNIIQADSISPYEVAGSRQFLEYLYAIKSEQSCNFDQDYDKDGILNTQDNCSTIWNPNQSNLDNDSYGDVCDGDIDGDGIPNPLGIVNDYGFLDISTFNKQDSSQDNCPLVTNSDQLDTNSNSIGDTCEHNVGNNNGLGIDIKTNISISAPATIEFSAIISGDDCGSGYYRNFGKGKTAQGKTTTQVFEKGIHNIGLWDCHGQIAFTSIDIGGSGINSKKGLSINAEPISATKDFITKVNALGGETCNYIIWSVDNIPTAKTETTNATIPIRGIGTHSIQALCYDGNNNNQAAAQTNVHIYNSNNSDPNKTIGSAQLSVNKNTLFIGETAKFSTSIHGFSSKDIQSIERDFGDGLKTSNTSLQVNHIYLKEGVYFVHQIIHTHNQIIHNIVQLSISVNLTENPGTLCDLYVTPYAASINDNFDFKIQCNNSKNIKSIMWNYGDGTVNITNTVNSNHNYSKAGVYNPSATITLYNDQDLNLGASITVRQIDQCFNALTQPSNKVICDLDKDGKDDMCDNDIDGDGVPNNAGLILFNKPDCAIGPENINPNISQNPSPGTDNCPAISNPQQENGDKDQYGDICDKQPNTPNTSNSPFADYDNDGIPNNQDPDMTDSDHDGIPNHLDNLPLTPIDPHSINNSNNNILLIPSSIQNSCSSCPCGSSQILSPLAPGDIVYSQMEYDGGILKSNYFTVP